MSSVIGANLKVTLFGESHSEYIGITIDGLTAGLILDLDKIKKALTLRRPQGNISTTRVEIDDFIIACGYFNGYTTGTPITFLIKNTNQNSKIYNKNILRPSHADYSAWLKYDGFQDYRGGGHFSGRITAPLVILGSICEQLLEKKGVVIATHIKEICGIYDNEFDFNNIHMQCKELNDEYFATINTEKRLEMMNAIEKAKEEKDSLGGILETIVLNAEGGLGEPFFYSVESVMSQLLFSIPAVKAVEFGLGTIFAKRRGSEVNDMLYYENGIKSFTNNNGGINGGITNGMPILIKTTIKPTASIGSIQKTVDISKNENIDYIIEGRHDPCIVHRARKVVDAVIAYALVELYIKKYGYEWMEL